VEDFLRRYADLAVRVGVAEEVFTTPDFRRVDGRVASTRPISVYGVLLERVELTFSSGRGEVVGAERGGAFVREQFAADDGACRLGELALVDGNSPLARSGHLFSNILYDENITSHIAYGQGYTIPVPGSDTLSRDAQRERGINQSDVHTDLPIGGRRSRSTVSTRRVGRRGSSTTTGCSAEARHESYTR